MANAGEDDLSGPTIMVMGGEPAASAKSAAGDARAQSSANDTRSSGSGTAQTGGGGGGGRRRGSDRMKRKLPKGISLAEQVGLCETRWVTDTLKVASGEVEPHEVSLVGIGDEPHRAMLAYGDYLEIGFGVERDPAQARMWWARAAENRNRTAANRLKYGYVAHSDEDW